MKQLKNIVTNKFFIAALAVGLSMLPQSHTIGPIDPCITVPFCQADGNDSGWITYQKMGFPLAYSEKTTFMSQKTKQTTSADTDSVNIGAILVNVLLWYALLDFLLRLVRSRSSRKAVR